VTARVALAIIVLSCFAAPVQAQHCLGVGSAPVARGFARASAWTGEHRYARRSGAALAAPYWRLVGSLTFERIYDQEFAASINNIGAALVLDVPADATEGLWFCPAISINRVLGPTDFTANDESRTATDLSAGLGAALAIDASDHVRVIPSLSARYIATSERWTDSFEPTRRRRGSFTEIGAGFQFIFDGDVALAGLVQVPLVEENERSFPFWRAPGEVAWQLALSFQLPLRAREE
jgi:hypothetical protein